MPSIFAYPSDGLDPKVYVNTGVLPPFIDPEQLPTKKSPWRQMRDTPFGQSATMIMPDETYNLIWPKLTIELQTGAKQLVYSKVIMKLGDLLHGAFFTEYIKKGNIMMLSEGNPGVDNVFSLAEGTLRLELDKESYERAGLQGRSITSGGRKHVKLRYLIEIDLRQPSMLHGKKGFERIVWAAKNVFNHSLVWLFCDLNQDTTSPTPISVHHPTTNTTRENITTLPNTLLPSLLTQSQATHSSTSRPLEREESYYDTIEWLDLVSLQSPRVNIDDKVDPYISRYSVPHTDADEAPSSKTLRIVKWTGLISPTWLMNLLIDLIKYSRLHQTESQSQSQGKPIIDDRSMWLALTVSSHATQVIGQVNGYTVLLQPRQPAVVDDTLPDHETKAADSDERDAEMSRHESSSQDQLTENNKVSQGNKQRQSGGFQNFTCFQFVDSG